MLFDFLKEVCLDCVGCFKYSLVEGVDVNVLFDQVSEEVKEECWNCFM